MIKTFTKLTAVILFSLLISVSSVMASGKMEVKINDRVELMAESAQGGIDYKWVVNKGKEILSTQSIRNFAFKFTQQGEHIINLTATSRGNVVENTTIKVLVGERYDRPIGVIGDTPVIIPSGKIPLTLDLQTMPARDDLSRVYLIGEGIVRFDLSGSTGEIIEYRIDRNVFEDSDGNGKANDDIDNSASDSYLTGSPFSAEYKMGEVAKIVAEITLVDKTGKKLKEQIEIVFEERDEAGPLVAVLDVSPSVDPEDGLVHLFNDPHKVGFYARRSTGKILEYRIDMDIFTDSDGDGNPENDIDNIDDPSFRTGDVWEAEYFKTDEQVIAQLIIVGEGGKGSRIQKGIVFGDKPLPPQPVIEDVPEAIALTADKTILIKGDPIFFEVTGLQLAFDEYTFEWDFDGDGEVDKEIEAQNVVEHIYEEPGVFEVMVKISDKQGNTTEKTLEITSKDTEVTASDFTFTVDGNTVYFEDFSTITTVLANKDLRYEWSFGDTDETGYEEQRDQIGRENPVYTYNKEGKYVVTLTITDADDVRDTKSAEVEIEQDLIVSTDTGDTETFGDAEVQPEKKEGGSTIVRLIKILLYIILIVVALVFLIVGGFLVFLKVQHPDLTFDELVDELKAKLLGMMGVHEMGASGKSGQPGPKPPAPPAPETPAPAPDVPVEPEPETPVESPVAEQGPTPAWLKNKEVIEGEIEEDSTPPAPAPVEPETAPSPTEEAPDPESSSGGDDEPPTPPSPPAGGGGAPEGPTGETDAPASEKGPTPDWLKGV